MTIWMFAGSTAVLGLAVWLVRGLVKLDRLLREAGADERTLAGGSTSWAGDRR